MLVFVEEGKPEIPEKNPQSKVRTNNKLNPHEMASTGIDPGSQRWEAIAYPLHCGAVCFHFYPVCNFLENFGFKDLSIKQHAKV